MDHPFKNLNEAREQFATLQAECDSLRETAATASALAAEKETLQAEVAAGANVINELKGKVTALEQSASASLQEKATLEANLATEKASVAKLQKEAKSVLTQARELVAASAGAPLPIGSMEENHSEGEMSEQEFGRAMQKEKDPVKLKAMYDEYNKRFRSKK